MYGRTVIDRFSLYHGARATIRSDSQAVVPQQVPSTSRLEPERSDYLLPRLGQLDYRPIDSENGDIGLVERLPGQYNDVIRLNLHTWNLNDDLVYDALSYALGNQKQPT
jgi:hypothetical protein